MDFAPLCIDCVELGPAMTQTVSSDLSAGRSKRCLRYTQRDNGACFSSGTSVFPYTVMFNSTVATTQVYYHLILLSRMLSFDHKISSDYFPKRH